MTTKEVVQRYGKRLLNQKNTLKSTVKRHPLEVIKVLSVRKISTHNLCGIEID